jgi:hypothetical protein
MKETLGGHWNELAGIRGAATLETVATVVASVESRKSHVANGARLLLVKLADSEYKQRKTEVVSQCVTAEVVSF